MLDDQLCFIIIEYTHAVLTVFIYFLKDVRTIDNGLKLIYYDVDFMFRFFTASVGIHGKLIIQAGNKPTFSYSQYIIYNYSTCNKERLQMKNKVCDSNYNPLLTYNICYSLYKARRYLGKNATCLIYDISDEM